jgi:hypothetical protein
VFGLILLKSQGFFQKSKLSVRREYYHSDKIHISVRLVTSNWARLRGQVPVSRFNIWRYPETP